MTSPNEDQLPPADSTKPESLEESILDMLHMFDPTTALHELDLLDEEEARHPTPPAEPDATPDRS